MQTCLRQTRATQCLLVWDARWCGVRCFLRPCAGKREVGGVCQVCMCQRWWWWWWGRPGAPHVMDAQPPSLSFSSPPEPASQQPLSSPRSSTLKRTLEFNTPRLACSSSQIILRPSLASQPSPSRGQQLQPPTTDHTLASRTPATACRKLA